MTGLLVYVGVMALVCLVIVLSSDRQARNAAREAARRRHPGNYTPATEEAIEQAVAIVDDGKALVREAEDYLRRRAR